MNEKPERAEREDEDTGTLWISLVIRSHTKRKPRVRVVQSVDVGAGTVSLRLTEDGLVFACANAATVNTEASLGGAGAPMLAITMPDGELQISLDGPPAAWRARDLERAAVMASARGALEVRALPAAAPSASSLIPEAEWDPVDRDSAARRPPPIPEAEWDSVDTHWAANLRADTTPPKGPRVASPPPIAPPPPTPYESGDAPTRIELLDDVLEQGNPKPRTGVAAFSPPLAKTAAKGRGANGPSKPRISPAVRRFALFAMLAAALMLWLHARRLHEARLHAARHASKSAPSSAPVAAAPLPAPVRVAELPPPSPAVIADVSPDPAPLHAGAPAPMNPAPADVTAALHRPAIPAAPARLAADALANGAYADALRLYSQLAAQPGANPAYARIVESLQSRRTTLP